VGWGWDLTMPGVMTDRHDVPMAPRDTGIAKAVVAGATRTSTIHNPRHDGSTPWPLRTGDRDHRKEAVASGSTP